jgi:putative transposase
MPRAKRRQVALTDEWSQLRLFVSSPEQELYEALRPIVLFGRSPALRARETGLAERTLRRKAQAFDELGMASLFAHLPGVPLGPSEEDRRALPPRMRQFIVDLHAEQASQNAHEIATICYIRFGRRPSHHTVQRILAEGRKPTHTTRRYPLYEQMNDPEERRLAVIRLHADGWNAKSIAAYLQTTRPRVHAILRRWVEEGVRGLADHTRAPKVPAHKVTLRAMAQVRRLQANPALGEFRIRAALEQLGIYLSARTCGRILALNRKLYGLPGPDSLTVPRAPRERKAMPFAAQRRHQYWTTDIRYIDHPILGRAYAISILENFSRALLASVLSPRQDLTSYLIVLRTALSQHGAPEALISDHGTVFLAKQAKRIYTALGIEKLEIEGGRPWQSYIETHFNVQRRMADWNYAQAETWQELRAAHDRFCADYNYQRHFAHEQREDGKHSPAAVLGWVHGVGCDERELDRLFRLRSDRRVDQAGYVRFRRWRVYGEQGLAGEKAAVWLFGETLTLEFAEEALAQYRVEFAPDDEHFRAITEPRLFAHRFTSRQPKLWELGDGEWLKVLRLPDYQARGKRAAAAAVAQQIDLFPTSD